MHFPELMGLARMFVVCSGMARRSNRLDLPPAETIVPTLEALRLCRTAMIGVLSRVRINSPAYSAARGVTAAIDVMAGLLTADPEFFWTKGVPSKSGSESET